MKKIYLLLILFLIKTNAQLVFSEDFNYANNSTINGQPTGMGVNPWTVQSGTTNLIDVGTNNGLAYTGYNGVGSFCNAPTGNAARIDNDNADSKREFTEVTSGFLYFTFLINVTTVTTGYPINLSDGGTNFYARLYVRPSSTAGKINFGLSNTNTASYSNTNFDLNTTYLAIVKYQPTSGNASLWVRSSGISATEAAEGTALVTTMGTGPTAIKAVVLRQYDSAHNYTIDAIRIYKTWFNEAPCALQFGTETKTCNAVTAMPDTYKITIPFTGGGTNTYNLSTNIGTISGNSPSTNATGNVIIDNIPEGTSVIFSYSGCPGGQTFQNFYAAQECKIINPLPYIERFNYNPGDILTNTQQWSKETSASGTDNILVNTGSLTYDTFAGTGNKVSFSLGGNGAFTSFTSTSSGILYTGFMLNVASLMSSSSSQEFTAVLTDNSPQRTFKIKFYTRVINSTTFNFGLGTTNATDAEVIETTTRNVNQTNYVIIGYDFASDLIKVWINPPFSGFNWSTPSTMQKDMTATPIMNLGGFLLRQASASTGPSVQYDELKISTSVNDVVLDNESFVGNLSVNIYPNPAKELIYFETIEDGEISIEFFDALGKKVLESNKNNVDVSSLNSGVYLTKVKQNEKISTKKIIVE